MEQTLDTIAAMRMQEDAGYVTADWWQQQQQQQAAHCLPLHEQDEDCTDTDCRRKMAEWCIQVIDFCNFSRETAEIAMSYSDRFLSTAAGASALQDREAYRLACMTSLYTAIKIHESEAVDPEFISKLSGGSYTPQDVEQMESTLLQALLWRVNPPTCMDFIRLMIQLIPIQAFDTHTLETVTSLARAQIEQTVLSYDYVTVPSSVIAYCALMNAFELHRGSNNDPIVVQLGQALSQAMQLDDTTDHVCHLIAHVQSALYVTIAPRKRVVVRHHSPRSVMHMQQPGEGKLRGAAAMHL